MALIISLSPNRADAFWFFSDNASAAGSGFVPDASTPALAAAVNIDPNPDKGLGGDPSTSDNALLAHAGPSGTAAEVSGATPPDRISVYVVRQGDTLSEIADMFGVSVNTIIWANDLKNAQDVRIGDTLIILPISGIEHTVGRGETLKSIAEKYHGDATEIAQYNGLDPETPLAVGSSLIIPGGDTAPPQTLKKAAPSRRTPRTIHEPYLGGSGAAQPGYYENPIPSGIITQGLHGWNAIDIGAPRGTPIHAAAAGTVIIARNNGAWNGGYGNYVVITHGNDTQTLYAHMIRAIVSPGESVAGGQVIGYVGMTGMTTGPHVHFEVRGAANPLRNCAVGSTCAAQ